jgi:hypothetical protein
MYSLDNTGNYIVNVIDSKETGWDSGAVLAESNGRLVVLGRNNLKFYSVEN